MKRLITILMLLLAVTALGGLFGAPRTASADVSHSKAAEADARFTSMPDPCTEFVTWVTADAWTDTSPTGPPTQGSGLSVSVEIWDTCVGLHSIVLDVYQGWTDAADVQISRQHASAAGSVEICDSGGDCKPAEVLVGWDSQNAPPDIFPEKQHGPVCKFWGNIQVRTATATGAVLVEGMNLTPDPTMRADTFSGPEGSVCKI